MKRCLDQIQELEQTNRIQTMYLMVMMMFSIVSLFYVAKLPVVSWRMFYSNT
jgi:hypothetical protein